jgi:urease accessory protein
MTPGELTLIQKLPHVHGLHGHRQVRLQAERSTLAKRRWRGVAHDGREFGFDLDAILVDGTPFLIEGDIYYVFEQLPEEVLEIPVESISEAARVGWSLGNLHFAVEVRPDSVRVPGDPAVLQFLAREKIAYHKVKCVFQPISVGAPHHHDHSHHRHG